MVLEYRAHKITTDHPIIHSYRAMSKKNPLYKQSFANGSAFGIHVKIDAGRMLDSEVEELLLEIAENFFH